MENETDENIQGATVGLYWFCATYYQPVRTLHQGDNYTFQR